MPNEQDGKVKFGRSYVYLDPDSLQSTPDAATPGVWRVRAGVDSSGDPNIGIVNSVNTRVGDVVLTSTDVGLANVNNTSDANKPVSTAQQTALNAKIDTTTANASFLGITAKAADSELLDGLNSTSYVQTTTQFGGDVSGTYNNIVITDDSHNHIIANVDGLQTTLNAKADLVGGVVPTTQLPAIAITEYLGSVSSQAALLALSGQKGDWAIRTDTSTTWIITGTTPSDIGSWTELEYPAAPVSSVNGATGTVVLGHSDVGAASAAQGSTADTALQPGDNISQLNNNSGFITATLTNEEVQDIVGGMVTGNTETGITVTYQDSDGTIDFAVATQTDNNFTTTLKNKLDGIEDSATADQTASEILTALLTVDGAASGLDSDLLDGQHGAYYLDYTNFTNTPTFSNADSLDNLDSTQFLRSDAADVKTSGTLNFSDDVKLTFGTSNDLEIYHNGSNSYIDNSTGSLYLRGANGNHVRVQAKSGEESIVAASDGSVELYYDNVKKIETTNAGASVTGTLTATAFSGAGGSLTGVNASQLNSQNASYYLDYSNFTNTPTIPTNNNQLTNGAGYITSADGGNAATVDGLDSTDFLRSNANDSYSGTLNINGMEFIAGNVARNLKLKGTGGNLSDVGLSLFDPNDNWRVQLYGATSTYGFLDANWGAWDIQKTVNGAFYVDEGSGLQRVWNAGNDGSGSGLDADTVDGLNPKVSSTASSIAVRDGSSDVSLRTVKPTFADQTTISGAFGYRINNSTDNSLRFCSDMSAVRAHMGANNASNLTTGTIPIARISGGAGTGLDADLLDGVQGSNYLRSDQNDTLSGNLTVNRLFLGGSSNGGFDYNSTADTLEILTTNGTTHSEFSATAFVPISNNTKSLGSNALRWAALHAQDVKIDGNSAWHAGNDGASSGLDADTLDGQQGSYYLDYNNLTNLPGGAGNTSIGTGNSKAEIIDTGTDGRFIVTTEGSERLRIDSSGNVGVGTSSPNAYTNYTTFTINGSTGSEVDFEANGTLIGDISASAAGLFLSTRSADPIVFQTNNGNSTIQRLVITTDGNVRVPDNGKFTAGASDDLQIYHDGSQNAINSFTSNPLNIISNGDTTIKTNNNESMAVFKKNNAVELYYDNTKKLETTSIGVNVKGIVSSEATNSTNKWLAYTYTDNTFRLNYNGAGADEVTIDSSGNVGIGTTSPNAPLEVRSSALQIRTSTAAGNYWQFGRDNTTGDFFLADDGLGTVVAVDQLTGNVGIGTTLPSALLEVNSPTAGNEVQRIEGSYTGSGSVVLSNWRRAGGAVAANLQYHDSSPIKMSLGTSTSHNFALKTGDTDRLTIDNSGNIGIGTTSPSMKVNISHADQDGLRFNSVANGESFIDFADPDDNDIGRISYDHADNHLAFRTNNSERLRIDSSGNVGIGNSSPISSTGYNTLTIGNGTTTGGQIHIENSSGQNYQLWHSAGGVNYYAQSAVPQIFYTSGVERMRIGSSGVVTIGGNTAWHAGNDGAGSGLDADTLDGVQGSSFLRSDAHDYKTSGHLTFNDSIQAQFGSSGDLKIYHDGSNSYLSETGTGNLILQSSRFEVTNAAGTENIINAYEDGAINLYHNGSKKFETTSDGAKTTGNHVSTGWYYNQSAGYGIYNSSTDTHLFAAGSSYWHIDSGAGLVFYDAYNATQGSGTNRTGFVYHDSSGFGLLNSGGSWRVRTQGTGVDLYGTLLRDGSYTIWDANNDGAGSGLDADTTDGLHVHSGTNNEANKIVRTQANGYLMTGWINTTSGDNGNNIPTHVYASTDSYLRYYDLASFKSIMNVTAKTGYQGRETSTTDTDYWVGTLGWGSTNMNTLMHYGSGHIDSWSSPSNAPTDTTHWIGHQSLHYTNGSSSAYGHQFIVGAGNPAYCYLRGQWGASITGWAKMWNTSNDGSGSGLDADTVDGKQATDLLHYRGIVTGNWDTIFTTGSGKTNTSGLYQVENIVASGSHSNYPTGVYPYGGVLAWQLSNHTFKLYASHTGDLVFQTGWANDEYSGWRKIWNTGNDGSGSGLDADTLDGQQGSYYLNYNNLTNKPSGGVTLGKAVAMAMIFG